jgi:predicted nucleic acid-binding protein
VIVSDAGPLIVLLKISHLQILEELFGKIVIPVAVYDEITVKEQERKAFDKMKWIETRKVRNLKANTLLEKLIDKGEAEAIMLAQELKTALLIDDAKARKYAALLNVRVIGTLGLLKMAKNRGGIASVKKVIADMMSQGYYVDEKLVTKILEDVDES